MVFGALLLHGLIGMLAVRGRRLWSSRVPSPVSLKYQWYVGGKVIKDATGRRLALPPQYTGKLLTVRVKARAAGYPSTIVWTKASARVMP